MQSTPGLGISEVKCLGCDTHQTVALDIVRRPKATPVHELERYMRSRQCSEVRGYSYKRSHLVALRTTKVTASDPPFDMVAWGAMKYRDTKPHQLTVRCKERVQTNQTDNGEKKAINVNLDPEGLDLFQFVASIRHLKCAVHPELYLVYLALEGTDNRH